MVSPTDTCKSKKYLKRPNGPAFILYQKLPNCADLTTEDKCLGHSFLRALSRRLFANGTQNTARRDYIAELLA
jgi:hypothetical protein